VSFRYGSGGAFLEFFLPHRVTSSQNLKINKIINFSVIFAMFLEIVSDKNFLKFFLRSDFQKRGQIVEKLIKFD